MSSPWDESSVNCPYCGASCEAEFVNVGVGMQQVSPYHCFDCEAMQIGPYDKHERELTQFEKRVGWYQGRVPDSTLEWLLDRVMLSGQFTCLRVFVKDGKTSCSLERASERSFQTDQVVDPEAKPGQHVRDILEHQVKEGRWMLTPPDPSDSFDNKAIKEEIDPPSAPKLKRRVADDLDFL